MPMASDIPDNSRTFSRKICAKVLVSEDYVLKKEQLLLGYIRDLSYSIGRVLFTFEVDGRKIGMTDRSKQQIYGYDLGSH